MQGAREAPGPTTERAECTKPTADLGADATPKPIKPRQSSASSRRVGAADGELLTTEPIDTEEQLCRIVDWYRARWTIEEFFKALKSGCAIEKRQLESYEALTIALAIFIPIAWRMLLLRSLSRTSPDAPAATIVNDVQRRVLGIKLRREPSTLLTVEQCLYAIARLGGHLKSNGAPGWQTLGRGYEKLLILEEGFRAAMAHL
jgi:hypothetical protein